MRRLVLDPDAESAPDADGGCATSALERIVPRISSLLPSALLGSTANPLG
jgi:hypothetical protein